MTFIDADALRDEESKNLSRGGCLLVSKQMRPVGARVPITLVHPANKEEMTVIAEVVRAQAMPDGRWSMGMRFVDFDEAFRERVHQFVDSVAAPDKVAPPAPRPKSVVAAIETLAAATSLVGETRLAIVSAEKLQGLPAPALRMAALVDGKKTVAEVVQLSGMPPDQAASVLMCLLRHEVVKAGLTAGAAAAGPGTWSPTEPEAAPAKKQATVGRRNWGAMAGAAALAAVIGGYNVWYWLLRSQGARPEDLDPSKFADVVPMSRLQVFGGRAYGVVAPAWAQTSAADREKRIATLADRLKAQGVSAVYLTDASSKIVATWKAGSARVY